MNLATWRLEKVDPEVEVHGLRLVGDRAGGHEVGAGLRVRANGIERDVARSSTLARPAM